MGDHSVECMDFNLSAVDVLLAIPPKYENKVRLLRRMRPNTAETHAKKRDQTLMKSNELEWLAISSHLHDDGVRSSAFVSCIAARFES